MIDYKKALSLAYESELSLREIAANLQCSKSTIADFLSRFERSDKSLLSFPLAPEITNEKIEELLYKPKGIKARMELFREPDYETTLSALKRKGQTLKTQWRLYDSLGIVDGKRPYSYRQFCQKIADWVQKEETVSHIIRNPGENIELDYAGMNLYIKDSNAPDGETKVTIFIATLSYSAYFYAEALAECDEKNWIRACNNALYYFGGVTPIITPDNCKVAVKHNRDWINPVINETFQDWADYYETAILPANVRSPRWKPMVENCVGVVTRDILVEMDKMVFFSLDELNEELWRRVEIRNKVNFSGQNFSRYDKFINEEKNTLKTLPSEAFEYIQRKEAKVAENLSVTFETNYYTMLKKYVGTIVEIRATFFYVNIYSLKGDLLKNYPRCYGTHQWIWDEETKPRTASDYAYWSPDLFLLNAHKVGRNTEKVIQRVLDSRYTPNQSFRACYGILKFKDKYGEEVLEACCAHALEVERPSYTYIKNSITSFLESERDEEMEAKEMFYKVPDDKYSWENLKAKGEEKK